MSHKICPYCGQPMPQCGVKYTPTETLATFRCSRCELLWVEQDLTAKAAQISVEELEEIYARAIGRQASGGQGDA